MTVILDILKSVSTILKYSKVGLICLSAINFVLLSLKNLELLSVRIPTPLVRSSDSTDTFPAINPSLWWHVNESFSLKMICKEILYKASLSTDISLMASVVCANQSSGFIFWHSMVIKNGWKSYPLAQQYQKYLMKDRHLKPLEAVYTNDWQILVSLWSWLIGFLMCFSG